MIRHCGRCAALTLMLLLGFGPRAATAQAAGATRLLSWTADAASVREGDIITILIDELTLASADRNESNERERGRNVTLRGGTGGTSIGGSLRTGNAADNSTRGESSRRERFSAELSVQIIEMLPNGVARIEGRKTLKIDDHEQEVIVRGLVRTQDISLSNTVLSSRVAQAELLYDSNGKLGQAGGGIWQKILDLIIP